MTRIESTRPDGTSVGTTSGVRVGTASGGAAVGGGFVVPEDAVATASAAPLGEATPVTLGAMLAAEALDRDALRDRAARRHGQVVLAGLTALQRVLLEGGDQALSMGRLEGLIADMPEASDPRLAAVLGSIVLRVRVELARLGR